MTDKPNRYLVIYQSLANGRGDEEIEFDMLAWTAADAIVQSACELPGTPSLYPLKSIQPWTSELAICRQDEKRRREAIERRFDEEETEK